MRTRWIGAMALALLLGCVPAESGDDDPPTADAAGDGAEPEPDMALPDMQAPAPDMDAPGPDSDVSDPDMAPPAPDMQLPDPDMATTGPDMAPPDPDMAPHDPDMALPDPDMALPDPDMALPDPDMTLPDPDMALPDPDVALPDPDMALPDPDMALPDPDMAPPDPDMAPPGCPDGEHLCPEGCVADDAVESCGDRCAPCPAPADGQAICVDGACGVRCDPGFEACDGGCCPVCETIPLGDALGLALAEVDTDGRANDFSPSCQARNGADVAFTWTAPRGGTYVFDTDGSDFDTVLTVLDGGCEADELGCDDDGGAGLRSRVELVLAGGQAVTVVVDGYSDQAGRVVLAIRSPAAEMCGNGLDDDLDGAIDCDDADCIDDPACAPENELNCADGLDDDRDGAIDCADPDCVDDAACAPENELDCADGRDDDRDGATDCADPDCADDAACAPENELDCADGRDEDRDGATDCADPDCADDAACAPAEEADCFDGLDDDRDGAIDCADADCADRAVCLAARCRAPGGCADAACVDHPVCCADDDLGSAVGPDIAAADNRVGGGDGLTRFEGQCGALGPFQAERTFAWTAPADGYYLFDTTHRLRYSAFRTLDSVLYVLDDCADDSRTCNSDAVIGAEGSRVGRRMTAGETVLVVVDAQENFGGGDYLLSIVPGTGAALACADRNGDGESDCDPFDGACERRCACLTDDIGSMVELDVASGRADDDTPLVGSCGGGGPQRVFRWTAPRSGTYAFTARRDGAGDEPLLYILDNACDGEELGCDTAGAEGPARLTGDVEAGQTLWLVVDSRAAGTRFTLDVTSADEVGRCGDGRDNDGDFAWDCDDDDCADDPICGCDPIDAGSALGPAVARGMTAGQGHGFTPSCGGRRAADATVRWTAPEAGTFVFDARAGFAHSVAVLDGACDGEELACEAQGDPAVALEAGQTVTVVVDGRFGDDFYSGQFDLNVWTGDEAGRCEDGLDDDGDGDIDCADPDCADAPACGGFCLGDDLGGALGEAVFEGDLADATDDFRPRCLPFFMTDERDLGYRWTAPSAGRFQIDTLGSAARTNLIVLDGDCLGDQLSCAHWAPGTRQSRTVVDLEAGQSVVIVVDAAQRNPAETTFRINIAPTEFGLCQNGEDDDGDGLGDCEDPDCARDRICLIACADVDIGSETGERVLTMDTADATDDFDTECSAAAHDEVAVLWTAPATDSYRVSTAWSRISTSLALAESCAGPELLCNVDAPWSDAYSGFDQHIDAGESVLFLIEVRQLGEGEFTLNIE